MKHSHRYLPSEGALFRRHHWRYIQHTPYQYSFPQSEHPDLFPDKKLVADILRNTNSDNWLLAEKLCFKKDIEGNDLFPDKNAIPEALKNHAILKDLE